MRLRCGHHRLGGEGGTCRNSGPAGGGAARRPDGNQQVCPAPTAMAGDRSRRRPVPGSGCRPDAFPSRAGNHSARVGRGVPAPPPGGSRARPSHCASLRRGDHPQLYRPPRLRPHPPRWHSDSGGPRPAKRTAAGSLPKAIVVPKRPVCQPEPSSAAAVTDLGSGSSCPAYPRAADGSCTIVAVAETNGFSLRRMVPATQGLWPCRGLRAGGVLAVRDWNWKKVCGQ